MESEEIMNGRKVNTFIEKSEKMRNGFKKSLEKPKSDFGIKWMEHFDVLPTLFKEIYEVCDGTSPSIEEQVLWDFLPGYRLMQEDEIITSYEHEFAGTEFDMCIPFMTDCSGNYYTYAVSDNAECIILIAEGCAEIIHVSVEHFWDTVIAFYDEGVYYLDEDGYLSYDFEKEGLVGRKYNPGIVYWGEEC